MLRSLSRIPFPIQNTPLCMVVDTSQEFLDPSAGLLREDGNRWPVRECCQTLSSGPPSALFQHPKSPGTIHHLSPTITVALGQRYQDTYYVCMYVCTLYPLCYVCAMVNILYIVGNVPPEDHVQIRGPGLGPRPAAYPREARVGRCVLQIQEYGTYRCT